MYLQFKKGIIELCTLALLTRGDRYGYDIASELSSAITVADGSVYPILRRLRQEGHVSSYLIEASGGPPRKYYKITEQGSNFYADLLSDWSNFTDSVNNFIVKEGSCNE